MDLPLIHVAKYLGADIRPSGRSLEGISLRGAAADSRIVGAGELFIALTAERDGHDFVEQALGAGAVAALVERPLDGNGPYLVVPDALVALGLLAELARSTVSGPVLGITGSVGKTTAKDMVASILSQSRTVGASEKSFNNEIGVPLTIINSPNGVETLVIEMGARGAGHIADLCRIAHPTHGLVTTVAEAHTELFGGIDAIIAAKGELVESLPASGTAILNAEVPAVASMAARTSASVLTFGDGGEVYAENLELSADLRPRFRLHSPWGTELVELSVSGRHNVSNALGAAAAAMSAGASLAEVVVGLGATSLSPWRMDLRTSIGGGLVLNDSYNANPTSMKAALGALAELDVSIRRAYLGYMAELGDDEADAHREVRSFAESHGIEIIAVGTALYGTESFAGVEAIVEACPPPAAGEACLVKGSRVAGLEQLAAVWTAP